MATETRSSTREEDSAALVRLREENKRLREALEGVLIILGNPAGYCENDRSEVVDAIASVDRALGKRPERAWRRLHPTGAA